MKTNLKLKNNIIFIKIICIAVSLLMVFFTFFSIPADAVSVKNGFAKVASTSGANIRKEPNLNSKIVCTLSDNSALVLKKEIFKSKTSTSNKNRWFYVSANGKTGYIRADLVDSISYKTVKAKVLNKCNYRKGAGIKMKVEGSISKGKRVKVYITAKPVKGTEGSSSKWYKVAIGKIKAYICSSNLKLIGSGKKSKNKFEKMSDKKFNEYLKEQGFDKTYRTKLKKLHKIHPNWEFKGKKINLKWKDAVSAQLKGRYSLIEKNGWVKASKKEVSYYLDPRNFINETNIFMFENLSYNGKYQTKNTVNIILKPTYLYKNDFKSDYFMNSGKKYGVSPVHLASRARQETGGTTGLAINGKGKWGKKKKRKVVYNPFNIGAYEDVNDALKYAYNHGWTTKPKSVDGAAQVIAANYISQGQNTIYFQKYYFYDGNPCHQYMQNIKAPYSESYTTHNSYVGAGITNKPFSFIIPIYKSMP